MKSRDEKYRKTIAVLRNSRPAPESTESIREEVLRKISSSDRQDLRTFSFFDFFFGWTEIVWVRRSLITVSVMLVAVFIYQQSMIVSQLNWLSSQIITGQESSVSTSQMEFAKRLRLLKFSGNNVSRKSITIPEDQLDMLIQSLDKLQSDYDDLMKILQADPELKELVEMKLKELKENKVKL